MLAPILLTPGPKRRSPLLVRLRVLANISVRRLGTFRLFSSSDIDCFALSQSEDTAVLVVGIWCKDRATEIL